MRPLTEQEMRVLQLRYRKGRRALTHDEVGEMLGLAASVVRRIEHAALRQLRLSAMEPSVVMTDEPNDWDEA